LIHVSRADPLTSLAGCRLGFPMQTLGELWKTKVVELMSEEEHASEKVNSASSPWCPQPIARQSLLP
jgi:hypothetical protein